MPSRLVWLRIASIVAFVSVSAPLCTIAAAQGAPVTGAYERPVYSAPFSSASTASPAFAFSVPRGYYVAATTQHGDDDENDGGRITLFVDHTGDASCLARFDCSVTGGPGLAFHFTPAELGAMADPRALTAYLQHLDYIAPIVVSSSVQTVAVTPEPGSRELLATGLTGLAGVAVVRRRRR